MQIYDDINDILDYYESQLIDKNSEEYMKLQRVRDWVESPCSPLSDDEEDD